MLAEMKGTPILAAIAIAAQALSVQARTTVGQAQSQTPLEVEQALISSGIENVRSAEYKVAKEQLEAAQTAPVFKDLDTSVQQQATYFLALDDKYLGDNAEALQLAKELVKSEDADGVTWRLFLVVASRQHDLTSEAQAATSLARKWPKLLSESPDNYVVALVARLDRENKVQDRRDLLEALANSDWRPAAETVNTAALWYWIVLDRIERGDINGASLIASRIVHERYVIEMQVDKRFDSVMASDRPRLDPLAVAHQRLDLLTKLTVDQPRRIEWRYLLGLELTELGQQEDALAVLDKAIALSTDVSGKRNYDDEDKFLNWVLDTRATVLSRLGRFDEALAIQVAASKRVENGDLNVSNLLNLADMYVDLDRPSDALAVLARTEGRETSKFGMMTLRAAQVCAYEERKSPEEASTALAYVREHVSDGRSEYRRAMLCIDDRKAVVASIEAELADPKRRGDALVEVQAFHSAPNQTDHMKIIAARFSAAVHDPNLQHAIGSVGRINSYDLIYPIY